MTLSRWPILDAGWASCTVAAAANYCTRTHPETVWKFSVDTERNGNIVLTHGRHMCAIYYYYYYVFDVWIHDAERIYLSFLHAFLFFFLFFLPAASPRLSVGHTAWVWCSDLIIQYNLCSYLNHLYCSYSACYFIAHLRLTVIHLLYILWIFSH